MDHPGSGSWGPQDCVSVCCLNLKVIIYLTAGLSVQLFMLSNKDELFVSPRKTHLSFCHQKPKVEGN